MGNFDDYLLSQSIAFMQKHSQYGMLPLQSIKTLEMGDENMKERKFKVGDKVKVNTRNYFRPCVRIGEIVYINDKLGSPYLVGVKGFNGHSGDGLGGEKIAKQKGYDKQCRWCGEYDLELLEEKQMTGNKVIDLLMEELGVEVDEEFEIVAGFFNPYHFDKNGNLINKDGDKVRSWIGELTYGDTTIKKISEPEIKEMTIAEIEKELGYAIKVVKEEK